MRKSHARVRLALIITMAMLVTAGSLAAPGALGNPVDTGEPGQPASENPVGPQEMPPMERASRAIPSPDVEVYIDGSRLYLPDPPAIYNGRTLVPMRHFFEALDADVSWDGVNRIARGYRGGIEVLIPIWSNQPTVNGKTVTIDVAAQIWNDRTYIPLRFVGESLGDGVKWDGVRRRIDITRGGSPGPSPGGDPQPLGSQTVSPSDDDQTVTFGDVKVTIPGGVLDGPQTVAVSYLRSPPSVSGDLERTEIWEVTIGNMRQFRHPIVIELPYDPGSVPSGTDPEGAIVGLKWDAAANDWVELPTGVDPGSQRVTVTTRNLSRVGYSYLRRSYYVEDDRFIVYYRNDHQPTVYNEQGQLMTPEEYARLVLRYLNDAHNTLVNPQLDYSFQDPRAALWSNRKIRVRTGAFDESQYNDRTGTISITAYQDAMLENRLPVPGSGMEGARHDVTHEYFHAIQNSYMTWASMRARYWWIEATADYAAGGAVGTGLLQSLDEKYFQNPIYYRGGDGLDMYRTAHFVKFLVEQKGVNFQDLWEKSAEGYQVFDNLKRYISAHTDGTFQGVYRDFARRAFFSQGGPSNKDLNDMGQQAEMKLSENELKHTFSLGRDGTAALWVVKPEIDPQEGERTLQVALESDKPALSSVDIFVLPDNQRVSGAPQPADELLSRGYPRPVDVKQGETLYILATNTESSNQNIEVSVQGHEAEVMIINHSMTDFREGMLSFGEMGPRYFTHQFEAEAEPNGSYIFEWDFGDGSRPQRDIRSPGEVSRVTHTYDFPLGLWYMEFMEVTVKLYDLDDELLAQDEEIIATGKHIWDL